MESPLLLDTLIAWSSSHLALQDQTYELVATANRCVALRSLSTALSSSKSEPEIGLAACLIHCAMESITGDTKQWFGHLVGAYEMIRSVAAVAGTTSLDLSAFSSTVEGRWLLSNFAYHDIMMTVTEDRKPLIIGGEYWNFLEDQDHPDAADTYFGLASEIIYLISEISILNVDMLNSQQALSSHNTIGTHATTIQPSDPFSTTAHNLQRTLQTWTPPTSQSYTLLALANSYRSAALIHLYRTVRRHRPHLTPAVTPQISTQVSEIIAQIRCIPPGCLAESSLLLPLFMAGGEANNPEQIAFLRGRMRSIAEERQFRNVERCLAVLEEVWHFKLLETKADGLNGMIDWKDVLRRRGWILSIT